MKFVSGAAKNAEEISSLYRQFRGPDWISPHMQNWLDLYPSLLAYDGKSLAGFAYTHLFAPDILEVANIYVSEPYRNQTLGHQILTGLEEESLKNGYKGINLSNSFLHKSAAEEKLSPHDFYIRNHYRLIADTEQTSVYFKNIAR